MFKYQLLCIYKLVRQYKAIENSITFFLNVRKQFKDCGVTLLVSIFIKIFYLGSLDSIMYSILPICFFIMFGTSCIKIRNMQFDSICEICQVKVGSWSLISSRSFFRKTIRFLIDYWNISLFEVILYDKLKIQYMLLINC